nr:hypothetical protein [uncultured Paracoccus sp.]
MIRAARLLALLREEEAQLMARLTGDHLGAEAIDLILARMCRDMLSAIIADQDSRDALDDDEIDRRIEAAQEKEARLKRAARRNDFDEIAPALHDAADRIGLDLPELRADLGRRAIELVREICRVEARSLDGDDASSAAKAVAERLGAPSVEALMADPVHISAAWAQALKNYPTRSMKGNIDAPAKLLLEYFGDIPVSAISVAEQREFFAWMAGCRRITARSMARTATPRSGSNGRSRRRSTRPTPGTPPRSRRCGPGPSCPISRSGRCWPSS